ncbi:hypothetical protein ABPG72_011997 [Tetrahymena utriculariae]
MSMVGNKHIKNDKIVNFICDKASLCNQEKVEVERRKKLIGSLHQELRSTVQIQKNINNRWYEQHLYDISNIQDSKCAQLFEKLLGYLKIQPFQMVSTYIILWDTLQALINYCIFLELCICFSLDLNIKDCLQGSIFIIFALAILFLDIMFNFNKTYIEKGLIVQDRKQIAKKYIIEIGFLIDIACVLSIAAAFSEQKLVQYAFFIKLVRFYSQLNSLEDRILLYFSQGRSLVIKIIKFSLGFFAFLHLSSCLLALSDKVDPKNNLFNEYLQVQNISNIKLFENPFEKYLHSLFFVFTTIMPLGYNGYAPQNYYEKIMTILIITLGISMAVVFLIHFQIQAKQILKNAKSHKKNLLSIMNYMQLKQVSTKTQYSIFSYLNYRSTQFAQRNIFQEQTILNLLTPPLRQQLLFESHTSFIQNSHFLSEIFSPSFIYKLPSIIQELRVDPGEIIYRDNYINLNDNNLYIVQQGELDVQYQCDCHISQGSSKYCNYQKKSNESSEGFLVTKTLKKNDMLGFSLFFYPYSGRILRAKATTFTELLFINYKSFIDLLQQFPNDYEKFCYIRDEITINNNYNIIGQGCYFCGDDSHLIRNCNLIHYELNFKQKKNMFHQSSFQLQRITYQRLRKIKNKRIKVNEEEMVKYQKFKMKKIITLNQYSNHFKLNTQSSMSDLEDPFLQSQIKQPDQSKKKINYKSKTLEQQTSIKVGGSQPSSQQQLQHKAESQYKKQISQTSSQSINYQQFSNSIQQITQDQYQSDFFIDDPSQSEKQDAYLLHQNKQNQESKKELYQQNSSIADSMILELKPSSYNNLFERTKGEMDNNKNQKKIQKIKLYPHIQRSSSQISSQMQQCQPPQLQQNHLTINQTSNLEKRKNSYLQYDSRHSLDSNLMKLLYPTNKFNENGTQIYDNIFTQTVLQNMPGIQQVGNTNSMNNFNNVIANQTYQTNQQHNQLMESQSESEEQIDKKVPSIAQKIVHNIEKINQEKQQYYSDDCSICDFQYYYPYWNHEFVIGLINSNYLTNIQNDLNRNDNLNNKQSCQENRNSNVKQIQLVCSFYQLHSKNKKNKKIVQSNLKSVFEQKLAGNAQSMLAKNNDMSNLPLQSNYFNISFELGNQTSNSQTINRESPQPQMVQQNIQYVHPQQIQYSNFYYNNSHLKNQHIEQQTTVRKQSNSFSNQFHKVVNPIQKIPTDFKPKMKEFHEDFVGKNNNNNQDNNQDQQSEFLSNNNIPLNNQKSRELKFVESQYSFSKHLGLSKDRRKSDVNAITSHFNIKNKTLDNGTQDENQFDQETNTFENQKSDTDYQYIQSLKDQQNLVYSHYNSTKNENIYDSDQSNRFNIPNNFTFQVRRQNSNNNNNNY